VNTLCFYHRLLYKIVLNLSMQCLVLNCQFVDLTVKVSWDISGCSTVMNNGIWQFETTVKFILYISRSFQIV